MFLLLLLYVVPMFLLLLLYMVPMFLLLLLFSSTCYEEPYYTFRPLLYSFLHFLHLRPRLLSLCFYIIYLLFIYLVLPLLLIIFTFCLCLLLYIFFYYYSPVSSSTSPSISSRYCSSFHATSSTPSIPLLLHPLSPPYIPRFPPSPYFYIRPSSSSIHTRFLLFSVVSFHFTFNFFSILLSSSNLSLYRVTSKWMKSNSSFLITRSSTDQFFTRA